MKIVPGKLEALPETAWDTTMNIGLKGTFLVSQAAAKHMMAQNSGAIVNIASIAGLFPYNWAGAYSVVKAGLIMLTKLQAMEWAPYGIRANAIAPGYIRTPGTEAMYADPVIYEGRRKGVPMGRVGSGEDVAGPAVFLASDESRYTTGSILGADGGQAVGYFLSVPGRRFSENATSAPYSGSPHGRGRTGQGRPIHDDFARHGPFTRLNSAHHRCAGLRPPKGGRYKHNERCFDPQAVKPAHDAGAIRGYRSRHRRRRPRRTDPCRRSRSPRRALHSD